MRTTGRSGVAAAAALLALAGAGCHSREGEGTAKPLAAWPPATAAPAPSRGTRTAVGWVVRAGEDQIVVRRGTGGDAPDLRLRVTPLTAAVLDGRQRPAAGLQEGTRVRAAYEVSGGLAHATAIEITELATGQ